MGDQAINVPNIMASRWCDRHWGRVRSDPKINGLAVVVILVRRLLADEALMRRCGWNPETGAKADVDQINAELAKIGPVCCYLGDAVMEEICLAATEVFAHA